jgi:hypothetical protein
MRSRTPEEQKSRFIMAALPALLAVLLMLAIGGYLVAVKLGGQATGAHARIALSSSCTDTLLPVVQARGEAIGLAQASYTAEGGQVVVDAVLPGLDDDLSAVPALLARGGHFRFLAADSVDGPTRGEPLATEVDVTASYLHVGFDQGTYVQLDVQPNALRRLAEAQAPFVQVLLDEERIVSLPGDQDEDGWRLQAIEQHARTEVRKAADWNILLQTGPTPCSVEVASVEALDP